MGRRSFRIVTVSSAFLVLLLSLLISPVHPLEKMTEAELREVTGRSGFINSEEDLKKLESARNTFEQLVRTQGIEELVPNPAREKLLNGGNPEPESQAKLLQKTTRTLLRNPEFLEQVEQAGRALAQLSQALQQLQSLR